jgi:D-alanyl-D-alanine carboxypeptidase/D-alanyl-D-alanine-endopeptidase (penicillin-binding protein 4)
MRGRRIATVISMVVVRALLITALLVLPGFTQDSRLADRVEAAVARTGVGAGRIGIVIYSTRAEAPVYDRDAKKVFRLASNTKLLTTACAIAKLGPGYRYRTTLAWDDSGDLHVFGAGDPLIGGPMHNDDPTALFRDAAARLKAEGRTSFPGRLVLHPGIFDDVAYHPAWIEQGENQDAWWCAPVSGLSFNDNCVDLVYEAGPAAGDPVRVTPRPDSGFISLVNRSSTVKGSPDRAFQFVRSDNRITVLGELKVATRAQVSWIPVRDPALYFGTVLKETLAREGVDVAGDLAFDPALALTTKHTEVILAEHTLGDAVRRCNTVSQNLYAEMILKLLGFRFRGTGSTAAGIEVVQEFLRTDVGIDDVEQVDGSGLARGNKASAESMTKLLRYMKDHRHGKGFFESLAVGGESGTLAKRLKTTGGRVRAKTGSISGVSTLTGYAESSTGEMFVFSILVNNWRQGSPKQLQDAVVEILAR